MLLPLVFFSSETRSFCYGGGGVGAVVGFYWNEHELLALRCCCAEFYIHENEIFSTVPLIMNYDYYYDLRVCEQYYFSLRSFTVKNWMFKSNQVSVARIWLAINIGNYRCCVFFCTKCRWWRICFFARKKNKHIEFYVSFRNA